MDVPKLNRINVRVGPSHDRVVAMARALTTDEDDVSTSVVYRRLFGEAMTLRIAACSRAHQGPVRSGVCGHCGRSA